MQALLLLLYRNRVLFTFLFLEIFAFWLVVNNNDYQRIAFLSTSNHAVGSVLSTTNYVEDYIDLADKNMVLLEENARLREQIEQARGREDWAVSDTLQSLDSLYTVIPGRVVNNSIFSSNNHITINVGSTSGIEPGMGVLSSNGIVGKVKAVSDYYSTVYSVLHQGTKVSCMIKKNKELATLKWEYNDYRFADLKFVVKDVQISQGDTIVTSGYNSVFPPEQFVGVVDEIDIDVNKRFKKVKVELATNFSKLSHVYVTGLIMRHEKDSLEVNTFSN